MEKIRRGDVYLAHLPEGIGCEQTGTRPVLVIQNDIGNQFSPVIIIAVLTGSPKPELPTHVELRGEKGLKDGSIVLLEQIKTLDKDRLIRKLGHLSNIAMQQVNIGLACSVGLPVVWHDLKNSILKCANR